MSFCSKCGNEISAESRFCPSCGQAVTGQAVAQPQPVYQQQVYAPINLLQQLSGKMKTEAIIWIVIACLQVLMGIGNVLIGYALGTRSGGDTNVIYGVMLLIVAVINFIVSSGKLKYSREILMRPTGIVAKFSPIGGYIGTLIYNLLFGGIIGVVGSIFGFVTRSFVMNNQQAFQAIEAAFFASNPTPTR
ncbi:MAG: zinc-ribbon domain-containing protein [Acutalibacteraceae bacterium]